MSVSDVRGLPHRNFDFRGQRHPLGRGVNDDGLSLTALAETTSGANRHIDAGQGNGGLAARYRTKCEAAPPWRNWPSAEP